MKFKHKETGHIAVKSEINYFINTVDYTTNIPAELIEHSDDWEIIEERKYLFTTHDGVKLFEGDPYWWVNISEWDIGEWTIGEGKAYSFTKPPGPNFKKFSTKQAAKDYINLHKPKFSKKEIQDNIVDKIAKNTGISVILDLFLNSKDE